jgi:hypothetical protein
MSGPKRYLSPVLFAADFSVTEEPTRKSYVLESARDVGFKEEWLQKAIEKNPELVLAPRRAGGLVEDDERWVFWKKERSVGVGNLDVLLLSESGRIGIVETKLAYNPEARREVLAQLLEYALYLPTENLPGGWHTRIRPHVTVAT